MTYMPELKDALVRAAESQRSVSTPPRRTVRLARLGRLAPALGALVAVALAIGALVLTRKPVPPASPTSVKTTRLASLTALKTLNGFSLPPGAVPTRNDPSRPRQLGSPRKSCRASRCRM